MVVMKRPSSSITPRPVSIAVGGETYVGDAVFDCVNEGAEVRSDRFGLRHTGETRGFTSERISTTRVLPPENQVS